MAEKKTYNFGEKKTEFLAKVGKEIPVWQSPKYISAKKKVIEMLESEKYKNVLEESDFWILMNVTKTGKMAYTGLIISHNGCLKINDVLDEELKFKAECMALDKEGYNNSLVYSYMCPEQGLYEVGEVSKDNCKNDYPYAMALKRCFDRVVLKNSRLAYAGVYSDSEAEEFSKPEDDTSTINETNKKTTTKKTTTTKKSTKETVTVDYKTALIKKLKELNVNVNQYAKTHKLSAKTTQLEAKALLEKLDKGVLE